MEGWAPCKIHLKARGGKLSRAYVVLLDVSGWLEPRVGVVLLVRHPSGVVLQVPGKVSRRRGRNYAEIYIPMGVKPEKSTTIYGYAAQIKNVKPLA